MFYLNRACGGKIIPESFEDLQILLKLTSHKKNNMSEPQLAPKQDQKRDFA